MDAAQTGYELTFFVEKHGLGTAARNELFDHIFRHVTASGARLASPENGSSQAHDGAASNTARIEPHLALDLTALFASLTPKERAVIASKLKYAFYDTGETLVETRDPAAIAFYCGYWRPFGQTKPRWRQRDGGTAFWTGRLLRRG